MTALGDLNKMIVPEKFEEFKQYLQSRRDMLLIKDEKILENLNVRQTVGDVKNADGSFDITKVKLPEYTFEKIYKPSTLNKQIITNIPAKEVFKYMNIQMLIGKHLGMKWVVRELLEKGDPKATKIYNEILDIINHGDEYFDIKAIYKYFPCRKKDGKIEILSDDLNEVIETFDFPRQTWGQHLSLNDYIHPTEIDYIGMFVVSAGEKSRIVSNELKENGEFYKGHLVNSIGLELAESTAEYAHYLMRRDVGIIDGDISIDDIHRAKYQGNRYSFGYPACPDLSDQDKLFNLWNTLSIFASSL